MKTMLFYILSDIMRTHEGHVLPHNYAEPQNRAGANRCESLIQRYVQKHISQTQGIFGLGYRLDIRQSRWWTLVFANPRHPIVTIETRCSFPDHVNKSLWECVDNKSVQGLRIIFARSMWPNKAHHLRDLEQALLTECDITHEEVIV